MLLQKPHHKLLAYRLIYIILSLFFCPEDIASQIKVLAPGQYFVRVCSRLKVKGAKCIPSNNPKAIKIVKATLSYHILHFCHSCGSLFPPLMSSLLTFIPFFVVLLISLVPHSPLHLTPFFLLLRAY